MKNIKLINGDSIRIIEKMIAKGKRVDVIITDIPYNKTSLKWDIFKPEWMEMMLRVADTVITTCQDPISYKLKSMFPKQFKYSLIWVKSYGSANQAKYRPINNFEELLVFSNKSLKDMTYNPQMTKGKPYKWNAKRSGGTASGMVYKNDKPIVNTGTRYPKSILNFKSQRGLHPTQKPEDFYRWIILTYSNKGDRILDPFMGSGTTPVASIGLERRVIGIEQTNKYYNIAFERIGEI